MAAALGPHCAGSPQMWSSLLPTHFHFMMFLSCASVWCGSEKFFQTGFARDLLLTQHTVERAMATITFFYDNGQSLHPAAALISFGVYLAIFFPAMTLFWLRYVRGSNFETSFFPLGPFSPLSLWQEWWTGGRERERESGETPKERTGEGGRAREDGREGERQAHTGHNFSFLFLLLARSRNKEPLRSRSAHLIFFQVSYMTMYVSAVAMRVLLIASRLPVVATWPMPSRRTMSGVVSTKSTTWAASCSFGF